jgi:predicted membrane protein
VSGENSNRIFVGILIIAFGVIFLLGSLDRIDVGDVFSQYWPMILIFIGFGNIIGSNFRHIGGGLILIVVGGIFMLNNLDFLGFSVWKVIWPVLIISVGLWILFQPGFRRSRRDIPAVAADDINSSSMFSSHKKIIDSKNFRGGKASVTFGELKIDFSAAQLAGGRATVDLSVLFGSITVFVPRDWRVVVDDRGFLGSVEVKHEAVSEEAAKAILYVKAGAVFGEIQIR